MENRAPVPAIRLDGLTKTFGNVAAVADLSFTIPAGVIAGFVGPNGSGKTTTMRILATLLRQTSGNAFIFGRDVSDRAEAAKIRHTIGFMPDYFGLYSDMMVSEYLDFFGAAYRIPADKRPRLVSDIMALVSLTEKKDALIGTLSRGMQQKLALGRCLIHSPQLLLLDEPASGLDPRARIELMELLREMKNMGKTIFISSHILSELHSLCDMVVIIEKGRSTYSGGLAEASDSIMAGRRFLELTVATDPDAAAELLKTVPGVTAITRRERVLAVEHSTEVSGADIIDSCVKHGVRIEEARRTSANLEEIFMHMTGKES